MSTCHTCNLTFTVRIIQPVKKITKDIKFGMEESKWSFVDQFVKSSRIDELIHKFIKLILKNGQKLLDTF
jgi:hypothetical protein